MPELASQTIAGFLGVNLRRERLQLADTELAKAIGADLHTFLGVVARRLGTQKQFSTALGDPLTRIVRSLGLVANRPNRYRVAGRSVFRDATQVGNEILSANLLTTQVAARPLNDIDIWQFFADDAVMKKDNGTNFYKWGIDAPTTQGTLYPGGSGSLNAGTYSVEYTFARKTSENKVAHESNPSPVTSDLTSLANGSILVTGVSGSSDAQVTHVRFYRTVANGATWLFDLSVANDTFNRSACTYTWEEAYATATAFVFTQSRPPFAVTQAWEVQQLNHVTVDDVGQTLSTNSTVAVILYRADGALGSEVEIDNDPPPLAHYAIHHDNTMFLVGDADNPHYLWFSKRFLPESFPTGNFLEVGDANDPLQGGCSWVGLLAIFSRATKYRISGSVTGGFTAQESISRRGTRSPFAILPTQHGIVFVAPKDGIYLTDTLSEDTCLSLDIQPIFTGEEVNGFEPINWDAAETICSTAWNRRLFVAYPAGESTTPNMIAVYSVDTQKWYFYEFDASSLFVEDDTDTLIAGSTDGFVYLLEDGATDTGSAVELAVETKDYFGDNPEVKKSFRYFRVDADCDSDSIVARFYVDGALVATKTISGTRTKIIQRLPGTIGYSWRVAFSYDGKRRPKIYGTTAQFVPLQAA